MVMVNEVMAKFVADRKPRPGMMLSYGQARVVFRVIEHQKQALGWDVFQLPVVASAKIATIRSKHTMLSCGNGQWIDGRTQIQAGDECVSRLSRHLLMVLFFHPLHFADWAIHR